MNRAKRAVDAQGQFAEHCAPCAPLALFERDAYIKAHAAYISAKAGDEKSALVLIVDLAVACRTLTLFRLIASTIQGRLIQERFGDEFTKIFGIEPHALTANEAQYLVGFKSLDEIRNRFAAAEQEIDRRLRSKGISRAAESAKHGAHAQEGLNGDAPRGG